MENFKKWNNITGWFVFAISAVVYLFTIEPTASWWDCGEYIATTYKLQVGHPPGAPLFQLIGRFFSLFTFGDVTKVAMMVNAMSAICSAFAVLFLFWIITMLGLKLNEGKEMTTGRMYAVLGSGLVGALACLFSDTVWFSAVEGEVYAMSLFFTSIVFWAILKWERVYDQPHASRWIILIAYLMGLSIGVHLLNLLTIPAMALVFYYRLYKPTTKGAILTIVISFLILAFMMFMLIPYTVELAGKIEIAFVNKLGMPFNTGTIFYFLILTGFIIWGIMFTHKPEHKKTDYIIGAVLLFILSMFSWKTILLYLLIVAGYYWYATNKTRYDNYKLRSVTNTIFLSVAFILIGYSSFVTLVIRANTNTPINENAPTDAVSLLSYLNREQYGDAAPLFYGQYYNAPVIEEKFGNPNYRKDKKSGKYVVYQKSSEYKYDPRFCTVFPRMYTNREERYVKGYQSWGEVKGTPIDVTDREGNPTKLVKPTFGENLRFFFSYQMGHMYMRYLFWDFVGRQNDIEGNGGIKNGNWLSGIPFIDNPRLGSQSELPSMLKNRGNNKFYFLPLILGLIGMLYQLRRHQTGFFITFMLFFMTGIAIVLYLNFPPAQPRERDYAFVGSFFAFTIWIGLGVMAIWDWLKKFNEKGIAIAATAVCLLLVPGVMAKDGWDDHDRSGKTTMRDYAKNYLDSCEPNAILFTYGDNDTFPIWYMQEVEGYRTDVRVINTQLAHSDWYAHQSMRKLYNSEALPFTVSYDNYNKGINDAVYVTNQIGERTELIDILKFINSSDPQSKVNDTPDGRIYSLCPTTKLKITVDSVGLANSQYVPENLKKRMVKTVEWDIKSSYFGKGDLMMLDVIATNGFKRPVYFSAPYYVRNVLDASKYFHQEGVVYRFLPVMADSTFIDGLGSVNTQKSYEVFMKAKLDNVADPHVYVDRQTAINIMQISQNMRMLMEALKHEGKLKEAMDVADKMVTSFPNDKVPFDDSYLLLIETYYLNNAFDKGNKLANTLMDNYGKLTDYALSLKPSFRDQYMDELQKSVNIFSYVSQVGKHYKQDGVAKRADDFIKSRFGKFQ